MNLVVTRENGDWSTAVMHNMDLPSEKIAEAQEELQRAQR